MSSHTQRFLSLCLSALLSCSHPAAVLRSQTPRATPRATTAVLVEVSQHPLRPQRPQRPRFAPPAEIVRQVALTDETRASRQSTRPGTATLFAATLRPTPMHTQDGKNGWRINLGRGRPLATPAVSRGTVYVGGGFGGHEFYAFDALTGETRWALHVSDDGPTAAVVAEGVVAFNTESCTLFVVDAESGRMLWSKWLGDPLMSQPAIADGKVFMAFPANGGHRLAAFDLRSGDELWRVPISGDIISAPVIQGDSVYSSTFDGSVRRHRISDGALAWEEGYRATSAPWLYQGQVFVSRRERTVQEAPALVVPGHGFFAPPLFIYFALAQVESVGRLSGSSGRTNQSAGGYAPRAAPWLNPTVQRSSNYRGVQHANDSQVGFSTAPASARVDAAEQNVGQGTVEGLWEYQGSRPCVIDGRLFLTQGDQLVALDPDTGAQHWSRPLQGMLAQHGGHLASPPSAAHGSLYLATITGDVLVVSQRDGTVTDTIRVGSPMRFQPAIAAGHLYVGTANGSLMALDLGDPAADGWAMWGGTPTHNVD